jgi:predicted O-methyltransferase YrrM
VEFKLGDARESIAALAGPIDFVLLDLWKDLYIPCFDLFYPKPGSGAKVVADNMIFPEFSHKEAEDSQARAHEGSPSIGVAPGGERHRSQPLHARP